MIRCPFDNCSRLTRKAGADFCSYHTPNGRLCENPLCLGPLLGPQKRFCSKPCQFECNPGRNGPRKSRITVQLDLKDLNYVVAQATASRMSVQDYCRKVLGRDTLVGGCNTAQAQNN